MKKSRMSFDFMQNTQKPLLGNHGGPGGGPGGGAGGGGFYSPFSGVTSAIKPVQPIALNQASSGGVSGRWWGDHIDHTRAYLEAALAGDEPAAVDAVKGLWKAVLNWQEVTGSPVAGVLIAEHTALFKLLADSLAAGADEAAVNAAVNALVKNVETTEKLFPKDPTGFAELFGKHTELAGAYALDLAEGNMEAFNEHFAAAMDNGDELQDFTDQTFGVA